MAGKCKAAASGRWRRRRTQDTMAKPTAQELGSSADSGPAPRRRRSERGSLYSSTSLALPRRAARYAGPPRATRAASRHACRRRRQHWRSEAAGAGPGGGCSKSSEAEVTVQGVLSRLPSSSAPCGPAAGDEIGEPTGIKEVGTEEGHRARGGPRRPCRPSQRAWRGCTECQEHTGQAAVDEPCCRPKSYPLRSVAGTAREQTLAGRGPGIGLNACSLVLERISSHWRGTGDAHK